MRPILLNCAIALLAAVAYGQADQGAITGMVADPGGRGFTGATVQARNTQTGTVAKAVTAAGGKYTLADLPAGAYDVSVAVPGVSRFEQKGIAVQAAKTVELMIKLQEGTQLSTLGEDPLGALADLQRHNPPSGPTPRTADGKPDLSGVWWSPVTVDPGKPEWLPAAQAVARERAANDRKDSPQSHCMPAAVTRLGPLFQMVQSSQFLVVISDDDSPGFHQVYLDGRAHPQIPDTDLWYGHNTGRWEGDTLVIDRVSFNDSVWLDQELHPHSDKLHVIERYRRPDLGHMETEITVDDPGVLAKPYTMKRVADLAAHESIREFICTENERDVRHFAAK